MLVLVACAGAKTPGATTGSAGATGSAGSNDSGGAGGADRGSAGSAVDAETTGTAGASGTGGGAGGSDGGAPDDGAGLDAPPPDADLGSTVLPRYDGGIVSAINASNWDETTIHPF
ncbi:MAG TPA: hypothetical protein VK989_13495, partial [Polyangia bacterium]|nr:hypothetical protein [Polyangia bacterium]